MTACLVVAACPLLMLSAPVLAEDMSALQKAKWHEKAYGKLPEVYGPGRIIYKPLPKAGESLRQELEKITFNYRYTKNYQPNKFDCSDMSISLWYLLKRQGYNSRLVINVTQPHMWVGVEKNDLWAMIETTAAPNMALGITADSPEYFSNCWMFNSSAEAAIFTDDKLPLLLSMNRSLPIEAIEWRDV